MAHDVQEKSQMQNFFFLKKNKMQNFFLRKKTKRDKKQKNVIKSVFFF